MTEKNIRNIYENKFKAAYERKDYENIMILLLNHPRLENCLRKNELKDLVHFYNEYTLGMTGKLLKISNEIEEKYGIRIFGNSDQQIKRLMNITPEELVH